jgi:uncharacterized membrane protein
MMARVLACGMMVTWAVAVRAHLPTARGPHLPLPHPSPRAPRRALVLAADAPSDDHARARVALGGLASVGMAETAYLTANKLAGTAPSLCINEGACKAVLEGPWSTVAGVPLTAVGLLTYSALCASALLPLATRGRAGEELTTAILQVGTTAAAVFSTFLMLLLATTIHEPCVLCILSATISVCSFAVAWNSHIVPDRTKAAVMSAASAAVTSALALGVFALVSTTAGPETAIATGGANQGEGPFLPPSIETHSSPAALKLATRLRGLNARMFGAFWCSHCFDQKEALGIEAVRQLPYVECAKDGANSQFKLCRQLDVPGYPTWEIGGHLYPGEKSIDDLARLLDDGAYAKAKEYTPGQKK